MRNIIRKLAVCFLAWILVCTTVVTGHGMHTAKAAQTFKIHFIDVGCADAALLQYGEGTEAKYALIDTGANQYHNTKDTTIDTTKTPVYEYLNKMGVKHLEFILLTHPHQDHIGGMEKILSDTTIKIDKIYGNDLNIQYLKSSEDKSKQSSDETNWTEFDTKIYKNFKAALEARNKLAEEAEDKTEKENLKVDYVVPTAGETISLGEAKMTFYGPLENDYQYGRTVDLNTRQVNKYSIVTRIVYGSNSFLMTGDAQQETIKKIVARGYDLSAQVLKQPHHGYQDVRLQDKPKGRYVYDSDHKYLIDRTGASIAIISNGYKNVNQTPESNVLRDLSGMDVYQTSDKGTIVVSSDGKNLSVSAQKGGNVPSHAGYVVKQKRTPLMQKVTVQANTKKKMTPLRSDASAAYQHYERKNIKIRISAQAKSFTNLKQIQYKFVKKGTSKGSVPYKTGTTLTLRDGMIGRVYVRFVTDAGIDEMQLSGIAVDKKAPTKTKIKVNRSGIKTLKTSTKTSYNKKIKKSAKFVFSASYGISGKSKTQYKIVPKGKKASKYRWKTANKITYKKKNKKVSIYARFIDKCGNITQRKSSGFYITK